MLGTYWETGSLVKVESYMGETWELKERDDVSFYVSSSAYSPHLPKYPGQSVYLDLLTSDPFYESCYFAVL